MTATATGFTDDFTSMHSKANNIYGTVNINRLITSNKRGAVSRNNGRNGLASGGVGLTIMER